MKSLARWSIAAVVVGAFILVFPMLHGRFHSSVAAQAKPATSPVMFYRWYDGPDGLAHVEKTPINGFDDHGVFTLPPIEKTEIHHSSPAPPGTVLSGPMHLETTHIYVFNLAGHSQIEFAGGEIITTNPGDIELLVPDSPNAKGHRNLTVGPDDRVTVWAWIDDKKIDDKKTGDKK